MPSSTPVHRACGERVAGHWPIWNGRPAPAGDLRPLPDGYRILFDFPDLRTLAADYDLYIGPALPVVGLLKLAWPKEVANDR